MRNRYLVGSCKEALAMFRKARRTNALEYPVFVRPYNGCNGQTAYRVGNDRELFVRVRKCFSEGTKPLAFIEVIETSEATPQTA